MPRVKTPVEGFSGVVAGVAFTDGVGETDNPTALSYFRRHGYGIGSKPPVVPTAGDARTGVEQLQGDGDSPGDPEVAAAQEKAPAKKAAPKKKSTKKAAAAPAAKK